MKKTFELELSKFIRAEGLGIDKKLLKKAMDRLYHSLRKDGVSDTAKIWDLKNLGLAFENYSGDKKVSTIKAIPLKKIELKEWTPGSEKFDKKLFVPYKTKKGIDMMISDDGGPMLGTTYIVIGEAGVGKTTVASDIQRSLQKNYPKLKIGCVQSEMKRIDLGYEYKKKEWMKDLKYIILKDYGYENIQEVMEKIFSSGYDILFVDSVKDIADKLKSYCDMSETEAENYLLSLFDKANDGVNNNGKHTIVFAIQQVTKGGEYKGSTKLKHMTTGMMELRFDDDGPRYIEFSKNRRCGNHVNKRLLFSLNKNGEVTYDMTSFEQIEAQNLLVAQKKEELKDNTTAFFDTVRQKSSLLNSELTEVVDLAVKAASAPAPVKKAKKKSAKSNENEEE